MNDFIFILFRLFVSNMGLILRTFLILTQTEITLKRTKTNHVWLILFSLSSVNDCSASGKLIDFHKNVD